MGAVNRVMIGPAGTFDLHVTIATKQWGGREGASTALFDQWLTACYSSPPTLDSLGPPPFLPCI